MYQAVSYPEHGLYFKNHYDSAANNQTGQTALRSILNGGDSTSIGGGGGGGVGVGAGAGKSFKFAIVRHPWDRLVSSFRSKYEGQCNYSTACMESRFRVLLTWA